MRAYHDLMRHVLEHGGGRKVAHRERAEHVVAVG
jgi:hypothetical protein